MTCWRALVIVDTAMNALLREPSLFFLESLKNSGPMATPLGHHRP